jgi:transposase
MTWRPSQLTREQLEERRMEGGRLLNEGNLSQREIACELGVHEASVSRWKEIAEVSSKSQGTSYDPDHLSVVMRRLGGSVQRNRGTSPALVGVLCPQSKAVERDEARIQTWPETTLPEALKKGR